MATTSETSRRGFMQQPRAVDVWVSAATYGTVSRAGQPARKARAWLVHDRDDVSRAVLRVAANDSRTGRVVREDLGEVRSAEVRGPRLRVELASGEVVVVVRAPCVCGAGAAGMAGPVEGRHVVRQVRASDVEWLARS